MRLDIDGGKAHVLLLSVNDSSRLNRLQLKSLAVCAMSQATEGNISLSLLLTAARKHDHIMFSVPLCRLSLIKHMCSYVTCNSHVHLQCTCSPPSPLLITLDPSSLATAAIEPTLSAIRTCSRRRWN